MLLIVPTSINIHGISFKHFPFSDSKFIYAYCLISISYFDVLTLDGTH
jgi:hypothetical protein